MGNTLDRSQECKSYNNGVNNNGNKIESRFGQELKSHECCYGPIIELSI